MPEALPELVWFSLLFFCFAFVWAARKLLAAMFDPFISVLSHIPLFGGFSADFLRTIEQDIDNHLGDIEHGIDALMGASWHRFAELNEWLWRELKQHTAIGQLLAWEVKQLAHAYSFVRNSVHDLAGLHTWVNSRLKGLEREYNGIEHRVKSIERELSHGIGDDVLPRLKTLDREIGRLEHKVIPGLRAAEREADAAISDLYEWAKGKASLLGVGTFALAVATALEALGLGGLRCPQFSNLLRKYGCGLGTLLDGIIGLLGALFVVESVCTFLPYIEDAFGAVVGPIVNLLTEVPLGACETPPKGWAVLDVAAGPVPPPQTLDPLHTLPTV
jgi:hypothetical protein